MRDVGGAAALLDGVCADRDAAALAAPSPRGSGAPAAHPFSAVVPERSAAGTF